MTAENSYVLVTAAHNEAGYIENTLEAVIAQTVRPQRWFVVSDASTDATDDIVRRYAADHDFIELVRREAGEGDFGSQGRALMLGCERAGAVEHEFIGMLDADITFGPRYYEALLAKFREDPKLGVGGGSIHEDVRGVRKRMTCDANSVPGAIQFFRREAFAQTGGFLPLRRGGKDAIAEATLRMKGWRVRTFADIEVMHHRPVGACYGSLPRIHLNLGIRDYSYGTHPLFEFAKCLGRVKERPLVLSSVCRLTGYCWAFVTNVPREVPEEIVHYLRREQLQRLWHALSHNRN